MYPITIKHVYTWNKPLQIWNVDQRNISQATMIVTGMVITYSGDNTNDDDRVLVVIVDVAP